MPPCAISSHVQVRIQWGSETLRVLRLKPGKRFVVGDPERTGSVDFAMAADKLGCARLPLLMPSGEYPAQVLVPLSAHGFACVPGRKRLSFQELRAGSSHQASDDEPVSLAVPLHVGTLVNLMIGGITFSFSCSADHEFVVPARDPKDRMPLRTMVLSALVHGLVLAAAAMSVPRLSSTDNPTERDAFVLESSYWMLGTVGAADELPELLDTLTAGPSQGEADHKCELRPGGAMGMPIAHRHDRYGVQGPKDNADPHISKLSSHGLALAADPYGPWGPGMVSTFSPPWGRDDSLGTDAVSARGSMWGEVLGDSSGVDAMGTSGKCKDCGAGGRVPLQADRSDDGACSAGNERVGLRWEARANSDQPCKLALKD